MGRYLLDSNAFIFFKSKTSALRREALQIIKDPENALFLSAAALWEMADKASKGKLPEFAVIMDSRPGSLEDTLRDSDIQLLPIELAHISAAYLLPFHHRDPFDRLMIAQAMVENLTIVTSDTAFRRYYGLKLLPA